jgi:hypothetical protein
MGRSPRWSLLFGCLGPLLVTSLSATIGKKENRLRRKRVVGKTSTECFHFWRALPGKWDYESSSPTGGTEVAASKEVWYYNDNTTTGAIEVEEKRVGCSMTRPNKMIPFQHCAKDNKYLFCTTTSNVECRQKLFVQCKSSVADQLVLKQRYVFFITPTLPTRIQDLKWISKTLSTMEYAPGVRIHWIVIEDMEASSIEVEETMRVACQGARTARYTHLHLKKRDYNTAGRSKGVEQRNLGLVVVRSMLQREDVDRERSMVMFVDDDLQFAPGE